VNVGWRTAGVGVLQRGVGREEPCDGCKSSEEEVLLQSRLTNSGLERGSEGKGVALCVFFSYINYTVPHDRNWM